MAELSGPFFSPYADMLVESGVRKMQDTIGQVTYDRVMLLLKANIKKPTPYYWTQVQHQKRADSNRVTDRGVIYGPWLEGTSRRNQETRFKGYSSFRRATASMKQRSVDLAENELEFIVKGLN